MDVLAFILRAEHDREGDQIRRELSEPIERPLPRAGQRPVVGNDAHHRDRARLLAQVLLDVAVATQTGDAERNLDPVEDAALARAVLARKKGDAVRERQNLMRLDVPVEQLHAVQPDHGCSPVSGSAGGVVPVAICSTALAASPVPSRLASSTTNSSMRARSINT